MLNATASGQNPYSIHLDKSNGLPCNEIYNLHQDKKGFIWMASDLGLFRYDGFEYRSYYTSGMSSKSGSYIHEDDKGRIWYCTFDAKLYFVENDTLKSFAKETILSQAVEYAIIGNKLIALGRKNNLLIIDIYSGRLLKEIPSTNFLISLFQFDKIFSIGDGKSVRFMNAEGSPLFSFLPEEGNIIYKVIPDAENFYSLEFTKRNVFIYQIASGVKRKIYSEPLFGSINGFFLIDSKIYILKKEGITQFDTQTHDFNTSLVKNNSASHIIKDRNGDLWISSSFNGIFTFPSAASFMTYELPLFNCKIRIIENYFILYNAAGEIVSLNMSNNKFEKILTDKNKSTIYDVVPFARNSVDASTENENYSLVPFSNFDLLVLKSGAKEIQKINSKYIATAVTGFAGIQQILIGSPNEWDSIARRYKDTVFAKNRKLSNSGFIPNVRTKSVSFDSLNKIIYLATNLGIITATPNKVSELLFENKKIYAAKLASYSKTLFAFLHSGDILIKIDQEEVKRNNKINSYSPYRFFKLQDSLLFLGTAKELYYVNITNKDFIFKQIPFSKLISELNDIVLYDNHFYLSVNNQLIKISKTAIAQKTEIPFFINYIESKSNRFYSTTNVKLTANERDVKINFSALDYFQNSSEILYKINGEAWQKSDPNSRTIILASLAPDSYYISFSVNGKLYEHIVQFTISKPWYQSWWFIMLLLASAVLLIYAYYKRRIVLNKQQTDMQLEKANLEKDLRQSMLSSIKSQMNPHFLFNALNTIQSYIITEDKINASNYLSKFSKLTRKILEMSDKETVSLREEIDALMLYLELEKMRFQELNYTIEIDKQIQLDQISIPSMIIQPFVENAIKHGLLHSAANKQLFINISRQNQFLLIRIEDNGVGRKRSGQINTNKGGRHQSFASNANMKRVELLNMEKNEIGIEYIDKDEHGLTGTIVNIKIPLNN